MPVAVDKDLEIAKNLQKVCKKIFAIDIIHLLTNIFFVIYFENQNNLISKYFILKELCGDKG